jgi:acyl dehydratase
MNEIAPNLPPDGLAYEDYEIGKKITLGNHFLSSEEIIEFASKWDPVPFHIDEQAGVKSVHGGLIAAGAHMIAIRIKLIQDQGISPYVIATMGWDEVRFIQPGRAGDTLTLTFECIEKRLSKSKPGCGVVQMYFEMINQDNILVFTIKDTILVRKRSK